MEIKYTTKKVSFTNAMNDFTQKHFESVEKYLSDKDPIKITLEKDGIDFIIKCQVVSKMNRRIRAEVKNEDFYSAIVEVRDMIQKQLRKKKEKSYWKERIARVHVSSEVREEASIFVRNKVFVLDSITPEEAVDEMEAKGHEWYSFRDATNNDKISVVYKRFDGETFGLVELN